MTIDDNCKKTVITVVCDGHGRFGEKYAGFTINASKMINQLIVDLDIGCEDAIFYLNRGSTLSIIIEIKDFNLIFNVLFELLVKILFF
tara:strand:- start:174 stop:437 length:264 start_codon:yes stop_codon:yes gene_type:complete